MGKVYERWDYSYFYELECLVDNPWQLHTDDEAPLFAKDGVGPLTCK